MSTLNNLIDYMKIKEYLYKKQSQNTKFASPNQPVEIWLWTKHFEDIFPQNGWEYRVFVKKGTALQLGLYAIPIPESCDLNHPVVVIQSDINSKFGALSCDKRLSIFKDIPRMTQREFKKRYPEHLKKILEYLETQKMRFRYDLNQLSK